MEVELDQHFLENKEILEKEIEISKINKDDEILEIGPGDCRLTKLILEKKPKSLFSIEADIELEENLNDLKKENSNFNYKIENALNEINKIKFNKLISNIPYSITEPLYRIILNKKIEEIIILHGEKFYKQILDKKSKWHYFVNSRYNVSKILDVSGDNFEPIAKVKSVLLKLEIKDEKLFSNEDKFSYELFLREDRNIKNSVIYSLIEALNLTKKEAKIKFDKLDFSDEIKLKKLKNISNKEFFRIIDQIFWI